MARPEKTTVEYFSHDVKGGQTLFIIESMFGNDGYAFWFKLLEIIGGREGHSFDCGNPVNWKFLLAKTRVSEEIAESIMKTLVELEAIDSELWESHRIIWIQKFVDRLSRLYEKRTATPMKPSFGSDNAHVDELPERKSPQDVLSDAETHQRKEKKSKAKESKEKESDKGASAPTPPKNHARGLYGWVKLTDAEYQRLIDEYGEETTKQYIAYVDESAQQTGNKNKWKDWNLTVRKAIRERWGQNHAPRGSPDADIDPEFDARRLATSDTA